MTPAIRLLKQKKIQFSTHEYDHEAGSESYGAEAAEKLKVEPGRIFKTLIISIADDSYAVCLVSVEKQLDLKNAAKALGVKRTRMAEKSDVERISGYIPGGVSPIAQKRALPTLIDTEAWRYETIYVSAGQRGIDIEIAPGLLEKELRARRAEIAR
jgi:Cys-tRNA(Pro)/Cys-tRNA(Cys) deacylase